MIPAPQPSATSGQRKLWIQILVFLALVVLIWFKPSIEEWLDAQSPELEAPVAEAKAGDERYPEDAEWVSPISPAPERSARIEPSAAPDDEPGEVLQDSSASLNSPGAKSDGRKLPIEKMDRPPAPIRRPQTDPEKSNPPPKTPASPGTTELGKLKEIRNNVFQSSGGLVYRSGSEDGHRLKHVMQHAKDNSQKKIHGVFDGDGDRNVILAVIDEAFLKAKKGGSDVRSERQNDRIVYTVNLRRRIGQMGGEDGKRKGHPECRYVRIVLENDNEVITAYPTSSN